MYVLIYMQNAYMRFRKPCHVLHIVIWVKIPCCLGLRCCQWASLNVNDKCKLLYW